MNEYRLAIVIDANGRPAIEAINKVTGASRSLEGAQRGAAAGADRLAQSSKRSESELQTLGGTARRVQGFLAAVFGAAVVRDIINTTTRIDGMKRTLEGVLGSGQAAAAGIAFIRGEADRLGVAFQPALDGYTKLAAAARGTDLAPKINELTGAILQAGSAFNLSGDQIGGAIQAIEQMISKGTVSAEELRGQLGERIPGAFGIAAQAMGVTTAELSKMLEKGQVVATDFLPKFAAELQRSTAAASALNAASPSAELERIKNELEGIATDIGGGIFEGLGDGLKEFKEQLAGINAENLGRDLGAALGTVAQALGLAAQAIGPLLRNMDDLMVLAVAFAGARGIGAAVSALKVLRVELAADALWTAWTGGARGAGLAADAFGGRLVALAGGPIAVAVAGLGLLAFEVKKNWDAIIAAEQRGAQSLARAQGSIGSGLAGRSRPVENIEGDVERLSALMDRDRGREQALERHRASLEALQRQYLAAGGSVTQWNELLEQSTSAASRARAESGQMAQALIALNGVASEAGLVQAKQAKSATELAAQLKKLADIEKANPAAAGEVQKVREQIIAAYQKEVVGLGRIKGARDSSTPSIDRERSARNTLLGIIDRSNAGEDKAGRLRAQFEQQQRRINDIVTRYPELADLASQAQQALTREFEESLQRLDPFAARLEQLEQQLREGSFDAFAADLLMLQIALDEAVDAGDTQRVDELTAAMEQLELQAGKAASGADVLRDANQRMAEDARRRAEEIVAFWDSMGSAMSDSLGDAAAQAIFHFDDIDSAMEDLGRSLMQIAERTVAQLISEFARLSVINPILNSLLGTSLQTGGSMLGSMFSGQGGGLLGSLFSGSGGSGGGIGGLVRGIVGGIFGSGASGLGLMSTAGAAASANIGSVGLGLYGSGGSLAGMAPTASLGGSSSMLAAAGPFAAIAAAVAANFQLMQSGWASTGGGLTLPNGMRVTGGGSGSARGLDSLARMHFGLFGANNTISGILSGSAIHNRLFGRKAPELTNGEMTMNLGPDGASSSARYRTLERGGVFRSDRRRWHSGESEEAQQAVEGLFADVQAVMAESARSLRGEAPEMISAALRTVQEFDSKGKVKSTKYFVDVLGRSWEEATAEAATTRITAEAMIATIDSVLGTTVQATGDTIADAVNGALDSAGNQINTSTVAGNFDSLIKSVGGSMGEASAIAERWRDDASLLLEGAGFLLAAATDMRAGTALITDGSLTQITELVESLQGGGESLIETYTRLQASTQLYLGALGIMDGAMQASTAEVVAFAAGAVEALGGLDAASQQLNVILGTFFTDAERAAFRLQEAQSRATRAAGDLGVEGVSFDNYRSRFEAARQAGLTPEQFAQWVRLGVALAEASSASRALAEATAELGSASTDASEAVTNSAIDMTEAANRALEAYEQLREFTANISGEIRSFGREGMDSFVASVQDVESWIRRSTDEANALARAAGFQVATEESLTQIRLLGAARIGQAIAALDAQTVDLIQSLYALGDAAAGAEFDVSRSNTDLAFAHQLAAGFREVTEAIDPQRYQQALQIAQNLFNLGWAAGDDPLNIAERMGLPFDRFVADLGVDLRELGEVANFDGLAQAARALGVELPELAERLGVSLGELSSATSLLNDGFERALGRLTADQRAPIEALLRRLESAPEGERAGIVEQINALVNALPAELRAQLAPYLDGVDLTPPELEQISATDRVTTAVSAGNTLLGQILSAIERSTPTKPGRPDLQPVPGLKGGTGDSLDLRPVALSIETASMREVTELQKIAANVRAVEGAVTRSNQLLQEMANEARRAAEQVSMVGV